MLGSAVRKLSLPAFAIALLGASSALAHRPIVPDGHYGPWLPALTLDEPTASGTWTAVGTPFPGVHPDTALLLTDGTVIMHDYCTRNWYRLTPDNTGDYANGSWLATAMMPSGYAPLYFASDVLADGRVMVEGGEYNSSACTEDFTNRGALYDPVRDRWRRGLPPEAKKNAGAWTNIGDAASAVLADGKILLQQAVTTVNGQYQLTTRQALGSLPPGPHDYVHWTGEAGFNKADYNDEEGWTLLPGGADGPVQTVDIWLGNGEPSPTEIYTPSTKSWTFGGNAANILVDPIAHEIGPAVLRPDGTLFQAGANSCGKPGCPGHTGIYDSSTGTWSAGPDFPKVGKTYYDVTDGPAALLPDGNVLVQASPAYACKSKGQRSPYCSPSHFYELDFTTGNFFRVSEPASAPSIAAFEGRMLVLPNGQILWSSYTGDVEVYAPKGKAQAAWAPTITNVPTTLTRGTADYAISGTLFNGLSQGAGYGDDAQMATNYPLVRITNDRTRHVCFARTHNHSTMGIGVPGAAVSTSFDMPPVSPPPGTLPCGKGRSKLEVIANGIASTAVAVTVN